MDALTMKLSKPIMVDNEEVTELPYNFDDLTARDKLNAGKNMRQAGIAPGVEEMDTDYHLYLFAEAVAKADPRIDTAAVLRISARDARKASALARSFFYLNSEE
jgi:hypothetical protein